jgi:hypothetical protein
MFAMVATSTSQAGSQERAKFIFPGLFPSLLLVWAVLLAANLAQDFVVADQNSRVWLLDVDVERSLYTWYSQLLLAGVATLLLDTGAKMLRHNRLIASQWLLLSAIFAVLSADEALSLHELLSQRLSAAIPTSGFLMFAWALPAGVICLVGLAAATPFLLRMPARVRSLMLISAAVFLAGAVGMEMVGGKILSGNGEDVTAIVYRLSVAVEEGLEGLGVLIFLYSHLLYRQRPEVRPLLQSA